MFFLAAMAGTIETPICLTGPADGQDFIYKVC
jgi:hypothetical protein